MQAFLVLGLCFRSSVVSSQAIDAGSDSFMMFDRCCCVYLGDYLYHDSLQSWYANFLQVAVSMHSGRGCEVSSTVFLLEQLQRQSWPIDTYASEEDFKPLFVGFERSHPKTPPRNLSEDDWAAPFLLKGEALLKLALHEEETGVVEAAIKLYM